jgi:hypothetical protein
MNRIRLSVLLAVLALAGCGGGGSDEPSNPEATVQAYLNALADNEGEEACGFLTPDIRRQIVEQAGSPSCPEAVADFNEFLGEDADLLKDAVVDDVVVRGDSASANVTGVVADSVEVELERIDGEWRIATFGFANQLLGIDQE